MSYYSRTIQLDYIRTIAIIFVVLHHVTDPLHWIPDFSTQYIFIHSIQAISHLGVPLFFLLSGFLLIKYYPISTWCSFYIKRFKRVIPAFVVYSYFYYVYNNNDFSLPMFFKAFLTGNTSNHLWFMYVLIGIYILTPVISRLLIHSSVNDICIFVAACFIGGCIAFHFAAIGIRTSFAVGWMPTWSVYFITGYLLKKITDNFKIKALLISFFIMWPITYVMGMFNFFRPYDIDLNMQIFSCSAFLIIYKFNTSCRMLNIICTHIGRASFSIYLSHVFFIILFSSVFPKDNYVLYTVAGCIFVLSGSLLLDFATKIFIEFCLKSIKTIANNYYTKISWQITHQSITKIFHLSYFK